MKIYNDILARKEEKIKLGGHQKYHEKLKETGKLFVRDRLSYLFDNGEYEEDGKFANCIKEDLPADGVVCAIGKVNGKTVCVMANDSTVKAGSWGVHTVEKIIR
ncbi:acyl-CoA carboxylase subunit beta, partial [Butyricicoccus sp. 1XD8-22]